MIKFCKIDNEFVICDDNTISKYNLKILYEITEEEYANMGGSFYTLNGELVFGKNPKDLYMEELSNLLDWFEEYDKQVNQYNRAIRLGEEYDKDINELDNQAKINAQRIKELKNLLK